MSKTKDQFSKITYLMIETNSSCNLKCTFCNREELVLAGKRETLVLSKENFEKLLLPFKDCPIDTIKVEGISEPMLNPEFDECLKKVREYFPKAFVIIATNLQYNLKKSPFLRSLDYVDMVYLSIDGIEDVYESIRTGSSYKKLLKSLEVIKRFVPEETRRTKLHINFTLSELNYFHLPHIYSIKQDLNLASVRINFLQNWNEKEKNSHQISPELLDFVKAYKQDVKGVPFWRYDSCFWAYEGIVVDCYGDFRQCVVNTSQEPLGNIFKDDYRGIYNQGRNYEQLRSALSKNKATSSCENCDYHFLSSLLGKLLGPQTNANVPRKFER